MKLLISILIFISCSSRTETAEHSVNANNSELTNASDQVKNVLSDKCGLSSYLDNPNIINEAKQLWTGELKPSDDDKTYNTLQQLIESSEEYLPFYILVADKINRKADGALTELTTYATYELVNNRTIEFFNIFNEPHCLLKDNELEYPSSFAQQYAYYLTMECDNGDYQKCTEDKLALLKNKCSTCDMDDFITIVRSNL